MVDIGVLLFSLLVHFLSSYVMVSDIFLLCASEFSSLLMATLTPQISHYLEFVSLLIAS